MNSPARPESSDWLSTTGCVAAFRHGRTSDAFARQVTEHLLHANAAMVRSILTDKPSTARINSWVKLLSSPDEAESRELFSYRPKDAVCYFGGRLPERQRWST